MKKTIFLAVFFMALSFAPPIFGQAAEVDCTTIQACSLTEPICPSGTCPAILMNVIQGGPADFNVDFSPEAFDCPGGIPLSFTLDLPPDLVIVFLIFGEPPPMGFPFSLNWQVANCTDGVCGNYIFSTADPNCFDLIGAAGANKARSIIGVPVQ